MPTPKQHLCIFEDTSTSVVYLTEMFAEGSISRYRILGSTSSVNGANAQKKGELLSILPPNIEVRTWDMLTITQVSEIKLSSL